MKQGRGQGVESQLLGPRADLLLFPIDFVAIFLADVCLVECLCSYDYSTSKSFLSSVNFSFIPLFLLTREVRRNNIF